MYRICPPENSAHHADLAWQARLGDPFGHQSLMEKHEATSMTSESSLSERFARASVRRSYASSSRSGAVFEEAVEVAGDVAGKAAFDLSVGLPSAVRRAT